MIGCRCLNRLYLQRDSNPNSLDQELQTGSGVTSGKRAIAHGQTLYAAAPEPKLSLRVETAGHNNFADVTSEQLRTTLESLQRLIEQTNAGRESQRTFHD